MRGYPGQGSVRAVCAKHRIVALLPATIALSLGAGCTEHCPGPGDGPRPATLDAVIDVIPSSLEFLTLSHGDSMEVAVTIRSVGEDELHLESVGIEGPSAFTVVDGGPAHSLAPGDETSVVVRFEPQAEQQFLGWLQIDSNDLENPQVAVDLLGGGRAPQIYVNPASWDFGDVVAGCPHTSYLSIGNLGSLPLTLEEIVFSPTSGEMSIDHDILDGTVLDPGDSRVVTLTYEPRDEMPDTAYLVVTSDDPSQPEAMASHSGTGHLVEQVVENFVQAESDDADILWVVDNSSSMALQYDTIATNSPALIDILDVLGVDYHLGVVTTDDAVLRGAVPVMTPTTPDVRVAFADAVAVGTMGSSTEMGFYYGLEALTPPLTYPGGANDGFLRDEATLHVIFVSDEAEQSPELVTDYVTAFRAIKSDPDEAYLSCVIEQNYGQRYEQAATMTGGIVEYLTNPNWINTMSQLAWRTLNDRDHFPLSSTAVEDTIEVEINDVPAHEGWYFDAIYNAVVFEPDYIPDIGDRITLVYHPVVGC